MLRLRPAAAIVTVLLAAPALAAEAGGHEDPIGRIVLELAVVLVAAKLGGELATRARQPPVLGELLAGVVLGNLDLAGIGALEGIQADPAVDVLAKLGVLLLLFEVGLESTVRDMLRVGLSSLLVAVIGVLVPFGLGWGAGAVLIPGAGPYVHAFLGATLSATSVGITARVLQDLGRSRGPEARVILGAAVIDDVLGLVILAVVSGAVVAADAGRSVSTGAVIAIVAKASLFLVGALVLGVKLSPRMFRVASRLQTRGVLLAVGLAFCFTLSWLSGAIGLAPIVGAFAAGLVLEDVHYKDFVDRGEHGLEDLIRPIGSFLVPIFFVLMGMKTDLRAFGDPRVLGLAGALTVAAIVGKQACGAGVVGRGIDRLTVGLGMIPRGEVGLIFANMGLSLKLGGRPLLGADAYSAIVIVVVVTTLVTPPALRFSLARLDRRTPERLQGRPGACD
ncbi:cation:proton antiporter [Anaeromyxobacter oryzae]|nr:cation:proton antiporter [Anaeromyxobacter oryzae]